ncbi:hypothetical protein JL475_30210 [Streptomyces sp. M2CJ-2]|uniref:hypothetical protein n=1 Tax=Streptomyces sp. M2CJ-2 TaxID=2803948 RepID=UPI0019282360|nr:hypothetical protein [Streptomyces sp. M2CJ-2]MBL3670179.1 hypothetical protein [Streptomyces sp. M2CJ-2]
MMRIIFGAALALLVLYPSLLSIVVTVVAVAVTQPAVIAFAAGAWAWPRIARRIKGWTA